MYAGCEGWLDGWPHTMDTIMIAHHSKNHGGIGGVLLLGRVGGGGGSLLHLLGESGQGPLQYSYNSSTKGLAYFNPKFYQQK